MKNGGKGRLSFWEALCFLGPILVSEKVIFMSSQGHLQVATKAPTLLPGTRKQFELKDVSNVQNRSIIIGILVLANYDLYITG